MNAPPPGRRGWHRSAGCVFEKEWCIVAWFRRTKRSGRATRKPTLRETRAAERTAKAETALEETEHKIHELADQVRDELRGSA